ncbi:MAG TPA: type II toxin-antitoxin system HicB family antitoxin [Chthonomonadaceae bacterium]|nr:type II toxin-antitoxin system HicB family antitoxin [Chthonomonadaceae bacterium]
MNLKKYAVVIERTGANYSAYSPDMPGCIATGRTVQETQQNFQAALQFHLDGLRSDGPPIPEPTSVTAHVSVAA